MNTKNNLSIGIWGYGIVGKAAVDYFLQHGYTVGLMDKREFSATEIDHFKKNKVCTYNETDKNHFFNSHDFLFSSPGIDISLCYPTHSNKWLHELDFFYHSFEKPIIAITGSIGKTSITSFLEQMLKKSSISTVTGGNIGIPTIELLKKKDTVEMGLLEVSSFQLNYCRSFAPHLSIWTNFYPNHLDYHQTEDNYFQAKATILKYQKDNSLSLIPWALRNTVPAPQTTHMRGYFTSCFSHAILSGNNLQQNEILYYVDNNVIMKYSHKVHIPLLPLTSSLLELTFLENILILASACDLLKIDTHVLYDITLHLEHRTEHIATAHNIAFYNDSKSTTTASTEAAVAKLCDRPLHLFLGGLSKGVDRTLFVQSLKGKVKHVYCFGKEADFLYTVCNENGIHATHYNDLESAINKCLTLMQPGDCVLLSPAGSSYDLYDNYEQRGNHFKELIIEYIKRHNS